MSKGNNIVKKVAKERIDILYDMAKKELKEDEPLSKEYIKVLTQISQHYKIKLDPQMKAAICKDCRLPLMHGYNAEIRVIAKEKRKIYRCKRCGRSNSIKFASKPERQQRHQRNNSG